MLNEIQIRTALRCYLFGNSTVYIQTDENGPFFVYHSGTKTWSKRDSDSFWDSWDFSPELFLIISNEDAVKIIYRS